MLHRKRLRTFATIAIAVLIFSMLAGLVASLAQAAPPPLQVNAKSAILMDYATGQVLFEKDADLPLPPASLTKLMTLHLAYKRLEDGTMKTTDKVQITTDAWAAKMPGSSVMFLAPGQNVTVGEIMSGLAVSSGNDAAIALAQHMAGSVEAFAGLMNKEAQDLHYKTMKFVEPAGLSPKNMVTAREYADFARRYIDMHPQALTDLHSLKEYAYPKWENLSPDERRGKNQATYKPILQENRNGLLWTFEGVDGLKTGFIDEAGYNIALTARRGEMRLIAVILGVPGANDVEGARNREAAGAALLSWGFQNFATVRPAVGTIPPVRVWKGAANQVELQPQRPIVLTVARGMENKVTRTLHQEASTIAPVTKGATLGELIYAADGAEIARVPLVAATDVARGGFFKRLWDSIWLTISSWLNRKK